MCKCDDTIIGKCIEKKKERMKSKKDKNDRKIILFVNNTRFA